ncbi:MAG: hypothetical protein GC157_07220 [Frankiales bacterium]|nr:hypothetical protein [Frankiales bacterium]
MIGTISRVTADGAYVTGLADLPGVELGPLPSLVHRYRDDPPADTERMTEYAAGDRVVVVEDTPNDFYIAGILA